MIPAAVSRIVTVADGVDIIEFHHLDITQHGRLVDIMALPGEGMTVDALYKYRFAIEHVAAVAHFGSAEPDVAADRLGDSPVTAP